MDKRNLGIRNVQVDQLPVRCPYGDQLDIQKLNLSISTARTFLMCVIYEDTIFLAKPIFSHRATSQLVLVSDMNVTALDPSDITRGQVSKRCILRFLQDG